MNATEETYTYAVYAICDGEIVHEETVTNDYDEACSAFYELIRLEREYRRDHALEGYIIPETIIHLSEPHSGILHGEFVIN